MLLVPAGALVLAALTAGSSGAAVCDPSGVTTTFTGAASGDWHNPDNWSGGALPSSSDRVCIPDGHTATYTTGTITIAGFEVAGQLIISSGTLVVSSYPPSAVYGTLTLSGSGVLGGDAPLTVMTGGTFSWLGSTHTGTATTTVASGGTLDLSGAASKALAGSRRIRNEGRTVHRGGSLQMPSGTGFDNAGRFEMASDLNIGPSAVTAPSFTNRPGATFAKTGGLGVGTLFVPFDNDGTVEVGSGRLGLTTADGAHTGSFSVLAGATLEVAGGTHVLDGPVGGAGTLRVQTSQVTLNGPYGLPTTTAVSGTLTINVAATLPTLNLSGSATLGGSAPLTIPAGGTVDWSSGVHTGAATTTVEPGATIRLSGTSAKTISGGRLLRNEGEATHTGGHVQLDSGSRFENAGSYEMTADLNLGMSVAPPAHFANLPGARFSKTAGAGTANIQGSFDNDGTVDLRAGTLSLNDHAASWTAHAGHFSVSTGGILAFTSGVHGLDGTVDGTGGLRVQGAQVRVAGSYGLPVTRALSGTLAFDVPTTLPTMELSGSATLRSAASLTIPTGGSFAWSGGLHADAATTTISPGGTLLLSGTNTKSLVGERRIRNEGRTVYSGSGFQLLSGTAFENVGTFELVASSNILGSSSPPPLFANRLGARFVKADSTGTSIVSVPFDNDGTVEARTGTLQYTGAFPAYSGRSLLKGSYEVFATLRLPGDDIESLAGNVTLDGATAQVVDRTNANAFRALATIQPTGTVTVRNGTSLASSSALVSAGSVAVGSESTLETLGSYTQTEGSTTLDDVSARLTAGGAGVDIQGGTLQGVGSAGPSLRGAGLIMPGLSPGTLSADGTYLQASTGALETEITAAGHDRLAISDSASLNGTLRIVTDPAFLPTPGTEITILTATSLAGTFTEVVGDELDGDLYYTVEYRSDRVVLVVGQRTVSVADLSVVEGTGGSTTAELTVSISRASRRDVSVGYRTGDGTATAGADYAAATGRVTFAPGETSRTVPVEVTGDALHERTEGFVLSLADPARARVDQGQAQATIVDDDPPPIASISDARVPEGTETDSEAIFTVSLSEASGVPAAVDWATAPGTATAPDDYAATSGTVTFLPGETAHTVTVTVVADAAHEPDEAFEVSLTDPVDDVIGDGLGVATIVDDDALADLGVTITDNPDPIAAGATLTYTATVSNAGPTAATGIRLTQSLSADVTLVGSSASQGSCAPSDGGLGCALGSLEPGSTAVVEVKVTAEAAAPINSRAMVTAAVADPDLTDNTAETTTAVTAVGPASVDLAVNLIDQPDPVKSGDLLTYTATVTNHGSSPGTRVVLTDVLPGTVTYRSATTDRGSCQYARKTTTVTCATSTLAPGEEVRVTIVTQVRRKVTVVDNTVQVQANEPDPQPANNTATASTAVRR